jgi:hypothetical protein
MRRRPSCTRCPGCSAAQGTWGSAGSAHLSGSSVSSDGRRAMRAARGNPLRWRGDRDRPRCWRVDAPSAPPVSGTSSQAGEGLELPSPHADPSASPFPPVTNRRGRPGAENRHACAWSEVVGSHVPYTCLTRVSLAATSDGLSAEGLYSIGGLSDFPGGRTSHGGVLAPVACGEGGPSCGGGR